MADTNSTLHDRVAAFAADFKRITPSCSNAPALPDTTDLATRAGIVNENAAELAAHHSMFGRRELAEQILADAKALTAEIFCGAQRDPSKVAA